MYGKSRKGARSNRGSGSRNYRKPWANLLKAAPYTGKRGNYKSGLKFATVGFTRDIEKKYMDKALITNSNLSGPTGINNTVAINNGFMYSCDAWAAYDFNTSGPGTPVATTNDLVKGLNQGTTANTRIGNKINVKYIKGAMTLTSAKLATPVDAGVNMHGEGLAAPSVATTAWQYLRTTWRCVIVRDMQVNSTSNKVNWNDVFENGPGAVGETGGVHAELKVENMGRFKVLSDQYVSTNAKDPQKTIRFLIPAKDVGSVRYNGPTGTSLTDKGIYVIWAAYVGDVTAVADAGDGMVSPTFTMHSRLCFTDD